MGRFGTATDSEEFHQDMVDAGPVECLVCKIKMGEGIRGNTIIVCSGCNEYICEDHQYRHPHCSDGR